MLNIKKVEKADEFPNGVNKDKFIDFLHEHLQEFRDKKEDIDKAIEYSFSKDNGKGGFLLIALQNDEIVGGTVINNSGMSGYIPDHFLVFIATHKKHRGEGIGGSIIEKTLEECTGDIALHVEYDNPAVDFYKKYGFTSKYAEMRYINTG